MKILSIEQSPLKTKRFRVYLDNGRKYDFGLKTGQTYIDHHDKIKRINYRARHLGSEKEKPYLENLLASPALFSFHILWGPSTSIKKNIQVLNKLLRGAK